MEYSEYYGVEIRVSSFCLAHHFLVLELCPDLSSNLNPKYILCYYCEALPVRPCWRIDNFIIRELEDSQWLVTDWKKGIVIPCGAVQIREEFDLRHYLAVHKVDLSKNDIRYLDEDATDQTG